LSTSSTNGYMTEDGKYVGVNCHFDGYPSCMLPVLKTLSYGGVVLAVERGLVGCGIRFISREGDVETYLDRFDEHSKRSECLHDTWPCKENSYNYRYRVDGTIDAIDGSGNVVTEDDE